MAAVVEQLALVYRRRRWRKRLAACPLTTLWQAAPTQPGPPYLALDIESTGLDPGSDQIVSLGWVAIDNERVILSTASHVVVRLDQAMNQSAAIHGLVDADLSAGKPLADAMAQLLEALAGRTLLVHGARLDIGLLNHASRQLYGAPLLVPYVDTLKTAQRRMQQRDQPIASGALRLGALRKQFGLPALPNHNALSDALATAELFLALHSH